MPYPIDLDLARREHFFVSRYSDLLPSAPV